MSWRIFCWLVIFTGVASIAEAQSFKGKSKGGSLPIEGKVLPEVTLYDESGEEFPIAKRLKGKHGVIIFGCLT